MDRADAVVAGDLGQHVDHGVAHAFGVGAGPHEQARARHRRERHGDLQLGIIAPAGALEGLRPAMVEDVFALAVALQIERGGAQQGAVLGLGQQVLRLPAGAPADRLGILQRLQEPVAEEGVAGRARRQRAGVPLVGIDRGKRLDNTQADGRRGIRHGPSIARNVPGIAPGICHAVMYYWSLESPTRRLHRQKLPQGAGDALLKEPADLVGREISAVAFARDCVEFHFDGPDPAQPHRSTGGHRRGGLSFSQARLARRALPGHRRDRPVAEPRRTPGISNSRPATAVGYACPWGQAGCCISGQTGCFRSAEACYSAGLWRRASSSAERLKRFFVHRPTRSM